MCAYISFSVSKTTRELLLEWNHLEPVDLSSDLKMPQFKVEEVETDICEESSLIGKFVKCKKKFVENIFFKIRLGKNRLSTFKLKFQYSKVG